MSGPISQSVSEPPSVVPNNAFTADSEPLAARIVGGITGAIFFALCALLAGPIAGIAIALVAAAAAALARRSIVTSTIFLAAAALSAVALLPSTIAVFFAALAFGEGLGRIARAPRAKG